MHNKDISPEEFKELGNKFIEWASDYIKNIETFHVLPNVKPGDIKKQLQYSPSEAGESIESIFADFENIILKGITHWNHPGFMAYFNSSASVPGILAELLISTLNVNGMLWKSAPASAELEEVTLNWLKQMLSLPNEMWGIIYDTASVSTLHAAAAAREKALPSIRESGMTSAAHPLILYCTEHTHSSIPKAALLLGIGLNNIRYIKTDDDFRMNPYELQKAIRQDKANGSVPFFVTATIGTTSTTSIDPLEEIGIICNKENVWLHVDAAHAGVTAILPEKKYILKGIERADSFVVNPHKWLFVPMDLSVLYVKDKDLLKRTFSLTAEYLKTATDNEATNYMDYGIQLGRRFRSLKLWFVIRYFGVDGLSAIIRRHLEIAHLFKKYISENKDFELMAPVPFSTVCFRAHPEGMNSLSELNSLNEQLMDEINKSGKIFLSHTKLNGQFVIRLVVSGLRTEVKHIIEAYELIKDKLEKLRLDSSS